MKKFFVVLFGVFVLFGCDLQPKIASIPDSVGDFITERYPTLLAEPDSEIYKTAVADYGVYASPTVYGSGDVSGADYVLYSPADDYMMPAQDTHVDDADSGMPDDEAVGDEYGFAPDEDVDDLKIPDYVTEKKIEEEPKEKVVVSDKKVQKTEPVEKEQKSEQQPEPKSEDFVRAPLREITIEKGDTLYSVSRKYEVPVNDLAVMNKISAPFTLSVGQKIKVPDVLSVPKYEAPERAADVKKAETKKVVDKKATEPVKKNDVKKVESKVETKKSDAKDVTNVAKTTATAKTTASAPKATAPATSATAAKIAKTPVKTTAKVATKSESKVAKKDTKKTEIKSSQTKSQSVKKADSKKSDVKDTDKKTETKKTERKAQQMVGRSSSKFSWPVRGKILSGYGSKSNGLFNDGINIQAARGTAVLAAENGLVAYAGNEVKGMGNLVIIQHADGWMTVYAHMNSFVVRRGHSVSVGQKIGTVGTSGKVDQPQLHFEIRKGTRAYNPVNYLKK